TRSKRDWSSDVCSSDLSPQSETSHVLPSETDSTQSVDEVLDGVESEVDPRSGCCRDDQTAFLGADVRIEAACGVPGQGPHLRCRSEERRVGKRRELGSR